MAYVRLQLEDVLDQLPALHSPADLDGADVLILASGFEPRSATAANKIRSAGARVPRVVLLHFPTNAAENAVIWEEMDATLDAISEDRASILMSGSFKDFERELLASIPLGLAETPTRIMLDISGASGRMILLTMRALFAAVRDHQGHISLNLVYTEAEVYAPSREEANGRIDELKLAFESRTQPTTELTLGLDQDPQDFCVAYEGHHVEDGPDRAIVICGFNAHRVRAALDQIDPSFNTNLPHPQVTYVAGEPPTAELAWRLDAMKELNAFGTDPSAVHFRTSSTLDYQETLRLLEQLYEQTFGEERVTVLPFGSKMQTVAAALFCELHSDVRAQVVTPRSYRGSGYSSGSGVTHSLDLGDLAELIDVFKKVGSIVKR